MLDFIPDGYTRKVGFFANERVHNAFWFEYRPYEGAEGEAIWGRILISENYKAEAEKEVLSRISAWSFDAPRDAAKFAKINSNIYSRIQGVIRGGLAPDTDNDNGTKTDFELMGIDAPN